MISTSNLQFQYNTSTRFTYPDLQCAAGETLLITGRSGSGKTTLLHLLCGILKPAAGGVHINGTNIAALSPKATDRFRGANIGIVYQKAHFLHALSVLDNIKLAPFFGQKKVDEQLISHVAERLNISHLLHRKPAQLSIGEQQRAGIARAVVNQPPLIIADEPTSALDDDNCREVFALLTQQAAAYRAALVIVTHDGRLKQLIPNQVSLT